MAVFSSTVREDHQTGLEPRHQIFKILSCLITLRLIMWWFALAFHIHITSDSVPQSFASFKDERLSTLLFDVRKKGKIKGKKGFSGVITYPGEYFEPRTAFALTVLCFSSSSWWECS